MGAALLLLWAGQVLVGMGTANAAECPAPVRTVLDTTPATADRTVALTFDDGPDPRNTPDVLDVLASRGVKATFFLWGEHAAAHPDLVRRIVAEGHAIGNHTWSHQHLNQLSTAARVAQIERGTEAVVDAGGPVPCFFRAPFGEHQDPSIAGLAWDRGMTVVDWSLDTRDWSTPPGWSPSFQQQIIDRATSPSTEHPIVIMHDGGGDRQNTVAALDDIISYYASRGYTFTDPVGHALEAVPEADDWNGDGHADVIAINDAGALLLYPGNGSGGWLPSRQIGHGWQTRDEVQMAGDWDGDGDTDIIARNPANGDLWLYRGDGSGGFTGSTVIGTRWNVFDEIIAPGDWDNDGDDDLLGRRASDGALFLYEGDGAGGFDDTMQVGTGWLTRDLITPVGDWDGDGNNDLLARNPATGDLWLYAGNGIGAFSDYGVVGTGWGQFDALVGPGDFSGDTESDVLARNSAGDLYMYRGNGSGGWLRPYPQVGNGWADLRLGG